MRLINTNTLELKEFPDHSIPPYVILSHVWGDEAEECHFQEFCSSANHTAETKRKNGYAKIVNFCLKCRESGYEWAWADTVCIDKANYDELNFAINSMFEWYQNSEMCFAYLEDTKVPERSPFGRDQHFLFLGRIRDCQWFKRGWTLQELIAPRTIRFFSREWKWFMSNYQAVDDISGITSLPKNVIYQLKDSTFTLQSYWSWLQYSPRSVLKWASRRTVRQTEDAAYSLLGLLNVKMDIHYGEGLKAFERLQTLLILQTGDPRCLLWENDEWASRKTDRIGLCPHLSPSISVFQGLRGHEVGAGEASQGWGVGDLDHRAGRDLSFRDSLKGRTVLRSLIGTLNEHFYLARYSFKGVSTASLESLIPLFTKTGITFYRVRLPTVRTSLLAFESVFGELPAREISLANPSYTDPPLLQIPGLVESEYQPFSPGDTRHSILVTFPYGNNGYPLLTTYPAVQLPYQHPGTISLQSDDGQQIHHGILVLKRRCISPSEFIAIFFAFYQKEEHRFGRVEKLTVRVLRGVDDVSAVNLAHVSQYQAQALQNLPNDPVNEESDLVQWRSYDEQGGTACQVDYSQNWYKRSRYTKLVAQVVLNVKAKDLFQFS